MSEIDRIIKEALKREKSPWYNERGFYTALQGFGSGEDKNRGIVRKDIYFSRTSDVPTPEYEAVKSGFARIVSESGRSVGMKDFGCFRSGTGAYSSPDWYQEQAMTGRDRGFGLQVSAADLDALLRNEPYQRQNPHMDVLVVGKDMTTTMNNTDNNFIFGYGPYPNNIISVKRFLNWFKDPALRQKCISILSAHEFGHNLGLVRRNFNIGDERYKRGHCNGKVGPCLMEQVNVPGARNIDVQARLLWGRNKLLCPDCSDEVKFKKEFFQKIGAFW